MGTTRKGRRTPRRSSVTSERRRRPARTSDAEGSASKRASQPHRPPFLVAAVGASAGGLEAFSALVKGMEANAHLALLLVQHLAPNQHSMLPDLLGRVTKLKVTAGRDQQSIEPGHVYVIPPSARMMVSDGHLRVRAAKARREAQGAVDQLFRSLADQYGDRAVGVVLSGSAQDGAQGIRDIKAAGGITLVQDPQQAAVDGMPRAAIATGAVDAVLPVDDIAARLVHLSGNGFFSGDHDEAEPQPPSDAKPLRQVFQLLRRATGVDFTSYKVQTLSRRLRRRMALHRLSDIDEYVKLLQGDPAELTRLQEELLIHVTSFFREPASYAALEEIALPRLFKGRDEDTPFRVWIPGCSTGEETYSVVMVLLEFLGERALRQRLQVFSTDVSDVTVERARIGLYPASIATDVSPARLRRFFTRADGGYRIKKELRDHCVFARQDVTRDPPFSRMDLIVCRNLLIYLNQETQRKVLGLFHYALRPEGILMLGRSESVGPQGDMFSMIDNKAQLYATKAGRSRDDVDLSPFSTQPAASRPPERGEAAKAGRDAAPWDAQSEANRFLLDRYAPPAVIVDADRRIVRSRGKTSLFLELPSGDASLDLLKMIRPELLPATSSALQEARNHGRSATRKDLRLTVDGRVHSVNICAAPLGTQASQFLVLFDEDGTRRPPREVTVPKGKSKQRESTAHLEQQLNATRQELQSIIDNLRASNEELQAANEEILSSNEELQSTNEELDTAKEELQSTNEELSTLNDELHGRNEELSTLNGDLLNLLASVQIPIVIVTRDLRIRRFTPAAEKLLNMIPTDVGRPIGHLKPNFSCPDLEALIHGVIDTVSVVERQVEGEDGQLFSLQVRPYKTVDNRIDGAVLMLLDVSHDAELAVAKATGEALISTVREPIIILDGDLVVQKANRAFAEKFKVGATDIEGRYLYDLGDKAWDIPALRSLLEDVLPRRKNFEGFEVDHVFPKIGRKRMLLDARRIEAGRRRKGVILLVVRDVTDHAL